MHTDVTADNVKKKRPTVKENCVKLLLRTTSVVMTMVILSMKMLDGKF